MIAFRCRLHVASVVVMLSLAGIASWQERCEGQESEDVVYLKDGSVIRGTIIEQVPGQSILIQTRDGNRFRYPMDAIERIAKEARRASTERGPKNPTTAGLLSGLLVGAGQGYNGEWGKAALFFGGAIVFGGAAITAAGSDACYNDGECGAAAGYALAWVGLAIWSIADAVSSAKRVNRVKVGVGPVKLAPSLGPAVRYGAPAPYTWGLRFRMVRAQF